MVSPAGFCIRGLRRMGRCRASRMGRHHMQDSTFMGLDVYKATISIVVAQGERRGEVLHWGKVPHRADHIRKLVGKLAADGRRLHFCYEAGPCGYRRLVVAEAHQDHHPVAAGRILSAESSSSKPRLSPVCHRPRSVHLTRAARPRDAQGSRP